MQNSYNDTAGGNTGDPLLRMFNLHRLGSSSAQPDVPVALDEIAVSVKVAGTTFTAVYGVADGILDLISADLGEGKTALAGRLAHTAARTLLRNMARLEMARTQVPFMPDYQFPARKPGRRPAKKSMVGAVGFEPTTR